MVLNLRSVGSEATLFIEFISLPGPFDLERSTIEFLAIESVKRGIGIFFLLVVHKSVEVLMKKARSTRHTVGHLGNYTQGQEKARLLRKAQERRTAGEEEETNKRKFTEVAHNQVHLYGRTGALIASKYPHRFIVSL